VLVKINFERLYMRQFNGRLRHTVWKNL